MCLCRTTNSALAYGMKTLTTLGMVEWPALRHAQGQRCGVWSGLWAKKAFQLWTSERHTHLQIHSWCDICSNATLSFFSQEGVNLGMYSPLEVSVDTDEGAVLCRTYQMNNFHACLPSPQYKQVQTNTNLHIPLLEVCSTVHVIYFSVLWIRWCVWGPSRTTSQ